MSRREPSIIRALAYIEAQSKGWPVGIPVRISVAKKLQALGYAESAPCSYIHLIPKPVRAVRLTGQGRAYLKIYQDADKRVGKRA